MTAAVRIVWRRGTAAQWQAVNTLLASGEAGFEIDTGRFKIGDGSTLWSDLEYFTSGTSTLAGLYDVEASARVDGSVLVYDGVSAKFVADNITTRLKLTDGGNF